MSRRPLGDYSAYLRDLGDISHARIYANWGPALAQLSKKAQAAVVSLALLCKGLAGEEGGEASYNEIAAHANCWGRRSMVAAVKELEEKGWLEIERHRSDGKGWRISNRYLLIPPISPPVKVKRRASSSATTNTTAPAAAPPPPAAAAPATRSEPGAPKDPARALAREWYQLFRPNLEPLPHEIQRLRRYGSVLGWEEARARLITAIRLAKDWIPERLGGVLTDHYLGTLTPREAEDWPENRQEERAREEGAPVQEGLDRSFSDRSELDRSGNDRSTDEGGARAAQLAAEERLRMARPLTLELAQQLDLLPPPPADLRATKRDLILGERKSLSQELIDANQIALTLTDAIRQAPRIERLIDLAQAHLQRHRTTG